MLTRRHFVRSSALATAAALVAPRAFAAIEDPLALTIAPDEVLAEGDITLPPDYDGNFHIPEQYRARIVPVRPGLTPNDVHVLRQNRHVYFILPGNRAIRYGVAVGSEGLYWTGTATIGRKAEWPSWRPTDEMIARNPGAYAQYANGMPGGPGNPLGARALYFYQGDRDTTIRIHGTNAPSSIGRSVSNGCFRMYNSHVMDLYRRVPLGASAYAY